MAWRFNPSKFKNTTPKTPKKEETIFEVPVGTMSSGNNGITCSDTLLAFNIDGDGGKLGILPYDARGRHQRKDLKIVCAHSEPLNDFTFLPFDSTLLATCCRDEKLKLWRIENALDLTPTGDPLTTVDLGRDVFVECLAAHRTAAGILAAASDRQVAVIDLGSEAVAACLNASFEDRIFGIDWSADGKLLAAIGNKGRSGTIFDPRSSNPVVHQLSLHTGIGRESRIIFADSDKIITSGFTTNRVQEIRMFDCHNWDEPVHIQEFSSSTGIMMPFYDPDTKLLFVAGKGTNKLVITELQAKNPKISPVFEFIMHDQSVGGCLGSKRCVDVMSGEVVKFYQLTKNSIIPIPCIVPRRSYRDFHADLFPETTGPFAGCSSTEWFSGCNRQPPRISLDPAKKGALSFTVPSPLDNRQDSSGTGQRVEINTGISNLVQEEPKNLVSEISRPVDISSKPVTNGSVVQKENKENGGLNGMPERDDRKVKLRVMNGAADNGANRVSRISVLGVASKYRHVETIPGGRDGTFTNIRDVNTRLPTESNGFCVSSKYAAVPLAGTAGVVSIVDLSKICKLPVGVIDGLQNHTLITDLVWNPFDPTRLACGLDNGSINFWHIPDMSQPLAELNPILKLEVSHDKIVSMRYNPVASDVMAVVTHDNVLSVWNLETEKCEWSTSPHGGEGILAIAWSADGQTLASIGRDLCINIFKPQLGNTKAINSKLVLEGRRAARIVFACNDSVLVLVHFTRSSSRQVTLLDANTLEEIHTASMDTSSQPMIPHYDFDSSVLFLTGKGDRVIAMYEVSRESPFLLPLSSASFPQGHQAISLQQKIDCDIRAVEFQKGWRLTEKSLERLSFRVPRVKKDLFQSDLFPMALATWIPAVNASGWFAGAEEKPLFADLCPEGMHRAPAPLASFAPPNKEEARPVAAPRTSVISKVDIDLCPVASTAVKKKPVVDVSEEQKLVEMSWSHRIGVDYNLEQDLMQGVAEEEWIED